jgi:hypothetical protein
MCDQCGPIQAKILKFRRLLTEPIDRFVSEELTNAVAKLETQKAELHPKKEGSIVALFSEEPKFY